MPAALSWPDQRWTSLDYTTIIIIISILTIIIVVVVVFLLLLSSLSSSFVSSSLSSSSSSSTRRRCRLDSSQSSSSPALSVLMTLIWQPAAGCRQQLKTAKLLLDFPTRSPSHILPIFFIHSPFSALRGCADWTWRHPLPPLLRPARAGPGLRVYPRPTGARAPV